MQARTAARRALECEQAARLQLALLGVSGNAVDLALSTMEQGVAAHIEERREAQRLLVALHAPVRIELAEYYETPDALTEGRRDAIAYDEGYHARLLGQGRTCRAPDERARMAFFRGWDACEAMLAGLRGALTGRAGR